VSTVPDHLHGFVDDAAVFPPGNAPLDDALRGHLEHRGAPYSDLVGPLVLGDRHLAELAELLPATGRDETQAASPSGPVSGHELSLAVVVSGGAGALEPAVRWATRDGLRLAGLEVAVRDSATGEAAHNARRIATMLDQLRSAGELDDDVPVHVEMPRLYGSPPTPDWFGALDELAAAELRLKLRTGGLDPDAFPAPHELAGCIEAALDREMTFKCTAGLHHAVRHRDPQTGFEHHGFLNVLLATRALFDGAGVDEAAVLLDEHDADHLVAQATDDALAGGRRWFTSFGSCSVVEPLEDLQKLGLVS
jgi:hypothetical protein